ncbi:MAG: tRNA threonylcarbamoyl adenosine modification protein YjeE [Rickettsiales bacterium]|jgi:tRNA threonylcarbamoyl adenosine modification protein YjeE
MKEVNQSQMQELAANLAQDAKIGDIFGLKGTLGAGKSFFSNCFVNSLLNEKIEVLSPTFNLLYSYETPKGLVHHFDLYRIKNINELENIGFFDCLKSGICLIEWPEISEKFLKKNYTRIEIKIKNEEERIVTIRKI